MGNTYLAGIIGGLIIVLAVPATVAAQTTMAAVPQVSRSGQQVVVTMPAAADHDQWYIYYRTDRQGNFQVRKMKADRQGKATYQLATDMLYGRNVEYFIVKETAAGTGRSATYTIADANTNFVPEVYFQENPPLESPATTAADPLLSFSGSLSRTDRLYQQEEDASAAQSTTGNLRVFKNISNEKFQFDFDSGFSFFSPAPAEAKALNLSSLMVRFKKGAHQVAMGDLAISQSEYTAPALNRRGIHYEMSGREMYFSAFYTQSQEMSGFKGFGIPPADAGIIGAVAGVHIGSTLTLRGLVLSGRDDLNTGTTVVAGENPFRSGNIFSFWGDLNLFNNSLQLNGEYARSFFGTSTGPESAVAKEYDNAWRGGLNFNWQGVTASANYRHIGENFNSIANLFQQNDREGLEGNLGVTIRSLSIQVAYSDQKSYLYSLTQDGQHEKRALTSIGWQLDPAWRIGADLSLSNLAYRSKTALPLASPDMDTLSFNGNMVYTFPAGSFTLMLGRIKTGDAMSNFSGQLACSLIFGQAMNLATVFSYQRSNDLLAASSSDIYSFTINSELTFIPQWFTFTTSGSYMRNVGDGFASTAVTIDANLNFFMAKLFKDKIQPMLTARGEIQSSQSAGLKTTNLSFWLQAALSF